MRIESATRLRGNDQLFAACLAYLCNELFRVSITIDICRINEVDAEINSFMQSLYRCAVISRPPCITANAPCSKTDLRYLPAGAPQCTIFHVLSLLTSVIKIFCEDCDDICSV